MPKCSICECLIESGYEYPESYCAIFGELDNIPAHLFKEYGDECGCTLHYKKRKKMLKEIEQKQDAYFDSLAEYYKKQCETKVICYICGVETTGYQATECDSNYNFVSEPCGQTICFKCWESQRRDSIYHDKEPDCCKKFRGSRENEQS